MVGNGLFALFLICVVAYACWEEYKIQNRK